MNLELDNEHVAEVFEILCGIPFEVATMHDMEPPTKRHAGIEQLIKQLDAEMNAQADSDAEMAKGESDAMAQGQAEAEAGEQARISEGMAAAEADEYHEDYEGR